MLNRIGARTRRWVEAVNPWTTVYGFARTLLALATALTLLFSHSTTLFRPAAGLDTAPYCEGLARISFFCILGFDLELARWLAIAVLLVVASGWRPRVTALFHWWISFSLQGSGVVVDGGDQVTAVLTLLLLPVALTDPRKWHWQVRPNVIATPSEELRRLVARSALVVTRIQVAGIYFHAAVAKLAVEEWKDGTALYYWLLDPTFGAAEPVRWLLRPLLTNGITVSLLTWGTIALETFLFTALVMPRRAWGPMLLLGVAFHTGIAIVQGLISFSTAMFAALILYLRPVESEFAFAFAHMRLPRSKDVAAEPVAAIR